jgi:hypothetical protein
MRAVSGCVLVALLWSVAPRTAEAQEAPDDVARARELFVQATELRDRGELRGALEKFESAHGLAVNPITTFELARTYATLGMLVEARDAYASIARLPAQAGETERATEARREGPEAAEELRRRIPRLSIKIAVPAEALSVTLDDRPVPAAALEAPRAVDPGTHRLVATAAGGARTEQTITVSEGESREVRLAMTPAAPAPAAELEPNASASSQTHEAGGNHLGPFAYAGFGVGAAGFVVGTVLAGATLSKASSISVDCGTTACVQSAKDASQSSRTLGLAAVVSYTLAAAGVGVGVADILLYKPGRSTESDHALRAWIGVGAAGVRGSF